MKNSSKRKEKDILGQELAFDIDPENISCPYHGDFDNKMKMGQGLSFCMYEYKAVRAQTILLCTELSKNFSKLAVVYSGRGFHVHVFDDDAFQMSWQSRKKLAKRLSRNYAIDDWVTGGEMRLIRLPFSLNGLVSRVCLPIALEEINAFNPRTNQSSIPRFLSGRQKPTSS